MVVKVGLVVVQVTLAAVPFGLISLVLRPTGLLGAPQARRV